MRSRGQAGRSVAGGGRQYGPQLKPVHDALITVEHPITIVGWLRKSAAARLMAQLAAEDRPITHELLDQLPQDKSLHIVRQILVHIGVLPERLEYLEWLGPWLEQLLTQLPSQHVRLIRPFAHWYVLRRARRGSERRPYTEGARLRCTWSYSCRCFFSDVDR